LLKAPPHVSADGALAAFSSGKREDCGAVKKLTVARF